MEIILSLIIGGLITYIVMEKRKPKVEKIEMSEEDRKKQEKMKKAFNELMTYDYETACRRD